MTSPQQVGIAVKKAELVFYVSWLGVMLLLLISAQKYMTAHWIDRTGDAVSWNLPGMTQLTELCLCGISPRSVFLFVFPGSELFPAHFARRKMTQTPPSFLDVLANFIFFIPNFSKFFKKKSDFFQKKSENQTKIILNPNPGSKNFRSGSGKHCPLASSHRAQNDGVETVRWYPGLQTDFGKGPPPSPFPTSDKHNASSLQLLLKFEAHRLPGSVNALIFHSGLNGSAFKA